MEETSIYAHIRKRFCICANNKYGKGPMLSWISSDIDIIFLVEMWEHDNSKVPNIEGFVLWSTWNKSLLFFFNEILSCHDQGRTTPGHIYHK
jgi:hypothetical protein